MTIHVRIVVVVFSFLLATAIVRADWAVVGSTGTIDEADLGKIVLNSDGSAAIRSTISSTSAMVRFPVPQDSTLMPPPPGVDTGGLAFAMRVRDNGAGARVVATLKRIVLHFEFDVTPQTGGVAATIDSDLAAPSDGWITVYAQHYGSCCFTRNALSGGREGMLFLDSAWVAEVRLIKNDATGNPAVMGVAVFRDQP